MVHHISAVIYYQHNVDKKLNSNWRLVIYMKITLTLTIRLFYYNLTKNNGTNMRKNRYDPLTTPPKLHRELSITYTYNHKVTGVDPRRCTNELEKISRMYAFITQHRCSESFKARNYAFKFGTYLDEASTKNLKRKIAWINKHGADPKHLPKLNQFITRSQNALNIIQIAHVQSPTLATTIEEAKYISQSIQHALQHQINETSQKIAETISDFNLHGNKTKTMQNLESAIKTGEALVPNMQFAIHGTRQLTTALHEAKELLSELLLDNLANSCKL